VPKKRIPSKKDERLFLVRLPKDLHQQIRKLSFDLKIPMAEICRQGLEMMLEKYQR
jgi:hypothetical protein